MNSPSLLGEGVRGGVKGVKATVMTLSNLNFTMQINFSLHFTFCICLLGVGSLAPG
jgi:hypothetical protein